MRQSLVVISHMRAARFVIGGSFVAASLMLVAMATGSIAPAPVELQLDTSTTVVLDKEINGLPAKTKLISTPSFQDYSLAPVVDGIKKRKELGWQECSWASEENESPHGIEIRFSEPHRGGRFQVTWAYDIYNEEHGKWWTSRDYVIQIKGKKDDAWKTVIAVKNNQSTVGSYPLPDEPIGYLRIYQLPGGGPADRPNIMWIAQVELLD